MDYKNIEFAVEKLFHDVLMNTVINKSVLITRGKLQWQRYTVRKCNPPPGALDVVGIFSRALMTWSATSAE
jgi:hypothetical protein